MIIAFWDVLDNFKIVTSKVDNLQSDNILSLHRYEIKKIIFIEVKKKRITSIKYNKIII